MSGRIKHMQRSHRSYRNRIPQFQQFFSRKLLKASFDRNNMSFAEHIASLFALFIFGRRGRYGGQALKSLVYVLFFITVFFLLCIGGTIENSPITSGILFRFYGTLVVITVLGIVLIVLQKKTPQSGNSQGAIQNQYNYTPDKVNYASIFHEGCPVVTTDEYYDGAGYHAFVEKVDQTDIGRPIKISLCGNKGTDWVSVDEIMLDKMEGAI